MAYTYRHGDRPLEGYTIQRAVGRGGFGEVYYAVSDGGRELALKYLRENPNVELRGVSHCINLKSPHLVSIFDVKKNADGEYFVIMEYVAGPSLRDLLIAEPAGMGPQKAAFFVREIAKGLGYLHDQGIVHRDLKPANIFYDDGYVKIGDYGLSKFISVSRHSAQTTSVGTVHYMAPEVGSGNYQRGIDIYALGVMLYEMLLGKVPFEGSSMGEVLMKHLTEQPEVDDLPAPFGEVIRKALAKDPTDRYQTVYEMVDDLLEVDDVKTSLAGFNPTSLGAVARRGSSDALDSPAPSPNPAPPHGPVPRRIPAGRRDPRDFELDADQLPAKTARRVASIGKKVDKRLRKLDAKHGKSKRRGPAVPQPPPTQRPRHSNAVQSRGETIQRLLLALAVAVGLGFGLGFLVDAGEEGFASAIMGTVALAGGIALGTRFFAFLSRRTPQPGWLERICLTAPTAAFVAIAMVPFGERYVGGQGFGTSDELAIACWAALMVVTFFSRWRDHIESGAHGEMSIWKAGKVALFALIMVSIFADGAMGGDSARALCAGIAAAASFVLQALAWLFPLDDWLDGDHQAEGGVSVGVTVSDATVGVTVAGDGVIEVSRAPDEGRTRRWRRKQRHDEACAATLEECSAVGGDGRSFLIDGRPRRWLATRLLASLVFLATIGGTIALIVLLAVEPGTQLYETTWTNHAGVITQIHRELPGMYDRSFVIPVAACAAGMFGIILLAARKMTRYKTGGAYRDTVRPILLAISMAGMACAMAALAVGTLDRDGLAGVLAGLVFCSMGFLFLLVKRGQRFEPSVYSLPSDSGGLDEDKNGAAVSDTVSHLT